MNAVKLIMPTMMLGKVLDKSVAQDVLISGLAVDSRNVKVGDLFLACDGLSSHGLDFAAQALERGAAAIAWEPSLNLDKSVESPSTPMAHASFSRPTDFSRLNRPEQGIYPVADVRVPQLSARLGDIADRFFGSPSRDLKLVGITGTNGKTSVAHYLAQVLDRPGQRCGVIGTLGNGFPNDLLSSGMTTPDAIEVHRLLDQFRSQGTHAVMEVSSHALDQGRVNAVQFDTAVFTNLTRDHLDYHGDMAAYQAAKWQLFESPTLTSAVINADDPVGIVWARQLAKRMSTIAYSIENTNTVADCLYAREIQISGGGIKFRLEGSWGQAVVESKLLGQFNVSNLLATAAVLLSQGWALDKVAAAISQVRPVPGRMEPLKTPAGTLVVIDFAHTPDALKKVLQTLKQQVRGKLVCVFGCGGDRDQGKRPQMGEIVERYADTGIVTNDNPRTEDPMSIVREIQVGMQQPHNIPVILDRESAIATALETAAPGDCVLIAGKGHENYQVIGASRLPYSDQGVVRKWLSEVPS